MTKKVEQVYAQFRADDNYHSNTNTEWCEDEFSKTMHYLLEHDVTNGFIEIGVRSGASFRLWAHFIGGVKIGIDLKPIPGDLAGIPDIYGIQGSSHDVSTQDKVRTILDGGLVDWLFIDGDHGAGVKQDYNEYKQFVRPGGYIGFHDVNNVGHKVIGNLFAGIEAEKHIIDYSCGIGLVRIPKDKQNDD